METTIEKYNPLMDKSMDLAIAVLEAIDRIQDLKANRISGQLSRSGTAVGAMVREAQNAESRRDFIHKLKIAAKEAEETRYWLLICQSQYSLYNWDSVLELSNEVIRIIGKSLSTAFKNMRS